MSKAPLEKFYNENSKLIQFATNKAFKRLACCGFADEVEREEIVSMLMECFIKAYHGFDDEKAKFSTYFMMSASNRITNLIIDLNKSIRTVSSASFLNEQGEECFDDLFGDENFDAGAYELKGEVEYIKEGLSPFARILLDYTLNPPEFIENEYKAQQAQSEFALSIGTRAYHHKSFGLNFVARCLRETVESPSAEKFIKDAVIEVKNAVSKAVNDR